METAKLKKFAQYARRSLIEQVSARLDLVLAEDSAPGRESPVAVNILEEAIAERGKKQIIERVAYIWFNRFCALRFMDANRYTRVGVVSPAEGQSQPEILADAKLGHVDGEMVQERDHQQILALLDGKAPSRDPQGEAYRLLLVAACNAWHKVMPFLFQRIDDYTELLMPDDLLSGKSILAFTREAMTPDTCKDVEVIGWLYQFYISEKKDEVFAGLKKNQKISPANIPAATQLFTPHWIVRYLVENSLGRLWMLNRPDSKLIEWMDYYIKPEQPETDFLRIGSPEEIRICDPACGSGHILTYAFDLLYAIYEEEGYEYADIPEKILKNNLYGIEIDERAGELAAFALTMKARAKQHRFFSKGIEPNICVLEAIRFEKDELNSYMDFIGRDLFTTSLQTTLTQFEEVGNFGSLIRPTETDVSNLHQTLEERNVSEQLFLSKTRKKVIKALRNVEFLNSIYHVVITNPPYMGGKGMNSRLGTWLSSNYTDVKSDLFSAFIVRCSELAMEAGLVAIMSPNVWMYISSHKKLRHLLIKNKTLTNLVELPLSVFTGATVQICAFNFKNRFESVITGGFVRLVEFYGADKEMASLTKEAIKNPGCEWFFWARSEQFMKIPGNPIAYWVGRSTLHVLDSSMPLNNVATARMGLATGNNAKYVRHWQECSFGNIGFHKRDRATAKRSGLRWFPYCKGGAFRRWYGNNEFVVDWLNDGKEMRSALHPSGSRIWAHNFNLENIFRDSITWSDITSGLLSVRYNSHGFLFDGAGTCAFFNSDCEKLAVLGLLNTQFAKEFSKVLNPTLHFQTGDFGNMPFKKALISLNYLSTVKELIQLSKEDWDSYETSWEFTRLPLLKPDYRKPILKETYQVLRTRWQELTQQMKDFEEDNNRIFIEVYGLQDELTPEVPLNEVTLTCNPDFRYGKNKSEDELEELLLADTMRELVSYSVGCMFGRYALDEPGLILANQGETIEDYLERIPKPREALIKSQPVLSWRVRCQWGTMCALGLSERFRWSS